MKLLKKIVRHVAKDHLIRLISTRYEYANDNEIAHYYELYDPLFSSYLTLYVVYVISEDLWAINIDMNQNRREVYSWFLEEFYRALLKNDYHARLEYADSMNFEPRGGLGTYDKQRLR